MNFSGGDGFKFLILLKLNSKEFRIESLNLKIIKAYIAVDTIITDNLYYKVISFYHLYPPHPIISSSSSPI